MLNNMLDANIEKININYKQILYFNNTFYITSLLYYLKYLIDYLYVHNIYL
jgi:hypothetical protein